LEGGEPEGESAGEPAGGESMAKAVGRKRLVRRRKLEKYMAEVYFVASWPCNSCNVACWKRTEEMRRLLRLQRKEAFY